MANPNNNGNQKESYHFLVVVLGDLGRSPRMMYHVLSLLQAGHIVTFVGYLGEPLIPALFKYTAEGRPTNAPSPNSLRVIRFPSPKVEMLRSIRLLVPIHFVWRIVSLFFLLLMALWFVKPASLHGGKQVPPQAILMQNPPAVPVLFVMCLYKYVTGAKLIIDWHNLGYSMIDKQYSLFRNIGRRYEQSLAPYAEGHLTVTRALQHFLKSDMGVDNDNCRTLYDCPPSIFRIRTLTEQHQILAKHHEEFMQAFNEANVSWPETTLTLEASTLFTEPATRPGRFQPRPGRPALLVSSTSYTKDEDLGILVDALQLVDQQIQKEQQDNNNNNSPLRIVCVITGKGPLKEYYREVIANKTWKYVLVVQMWMEPADYPLLLATADVGVSLHTSTSGMDLPIKILDYFGCEVPVCAYRFSCLKELVQDDVNGRTFETPNELSSILTELLEPLAKAKPTERLGNHSFGALQRYSLQVQGQLLWSENWPRNAWPVIEKALQRGRSLPGRAREAAPETSKED